MAIIDSNQTISSNKSGFDKGIQRSAKTMMLDNLQTFMYQKPIQSAVRECTSNAVDSVKEKKMAIQILTGVAKVEDYYISKESVADKISSADDDIYEDSEFNRDYYDLSWLDSKDTVTLTYKTTGTGLRDEFIITDPGVGLGGLRLEGFFNLGYSSKRLNTNELGGFGLGAKSPLSTGVESYRVTSLYNGKEFCFDIYSHKVDSVYSKWNEDGTINSFYEFETVSVGEEDVVVGQDENGDDIVESRPIPYRAYYKNTTEKNSVSISIEVRKHNRQQFFEAVKSQLMYLKDDIKFFEIDTNGRSNEVQFKANILYEDDNIIMSDYNYYTRPHFVIKNMGYGIIDFAECDLSPKFGNIGIKVKMENINVTPSRETVIYSTKTRDAILAKYDEVSKTVEEKIQEALNQDQFLDWLRACNKIMYSSSGSNDTITRLSSLIDKSSLKPKYKHSDIAFNSDIKQFITPLLQMQQKSLSSTYDYRKSKNVKKMNTTDVDTIVGFDKPLYLQFTAGNSRTTTYLASLYERTGGFCTIRIAQSFRYLEEIFAEYVTNKTGETEFISKVYAAFDENEQDTKKIANLKDVFKKTLLILKGLLSGRGDAKVEIYSEKLVPDGFKAGSTEEDEDAVEEEVDFEANWEEIRKNAYQETLKRRKENKVFIATLMVNKRKTAYNFEPGFSREEVSTNDLDYDSTRILYGTDEDLDIFNLLMETERNSPSAKTNESRKYFWNDDVKIMKLAKNNVRFVKNQAEHVKEYVIHTDNDGVLHTCDKIKRIFTADLINETLAKRCAFMRNFREFSSEIVDDYNELTNFAAKQSSIELFAKFPDSNIVKTLLASYQVQKQLLLHSSIDEDDKQDIIDANIPTVLDLDIMDIDLIDVAMYKKAIKLVAFADVYGSIFSYLEPLQDRTLPILKSELVMEIRTIIDSRKDQLEFQYGNIN